MNIEIQMCCDQPDPGNCRLYNGQGQEVKLLNPQMKQDGVLCGYVDSDSVFKCKWEDSRHQCIFNWVPHFSPFSSELIKQYTFPNLKMISKCFHCQKTPECGPYFFKNDHFFCSQHCQESNKLCITKQ